MELKEGVNMSGLRIEMLTAIVEAEKIWKEHGRDEGITITAGLDGTHMVGSLHYSGLALDLRTRYFKEDEKEEVYLELKSILDAQGFDVIKHSTHIHVEYDPKPTDKV